MLNCDSGLAVRRVVFGNRVWTRFESGRLFPQDINNLADRVRRYDSSLLENNPPYRDFTVVWGSIRGGAGLGWVPRIPRDYCCFVRGDTGSCGDGDCDGDISFDLIPDMSKLEPEFWNSGWVRPADEILNLFNRDHRFHAEIIMFGRENDEDDCAATPRVLLPGWVETAGNSATSKRDAYQWQCHRRDRSGTPRETTHPSHNRVQVS